MSTKIEATNGELIDLDQCKLAGGSPLHMCWQIPVMLPDGRKATVTCVFEEQDIVGWRPDQWDWVSALEFLTIHDVDEEG